jgi:hypothetical protein
VGHPGKGKRRSLGYAPFEAQGKRDDDQNQRQKEPAGSLRHEEGPSDENAAAQIDADDGSMPPLETNHGDEPYMQM